MTEIQRKTSTFKELFSAFCSLMVLVTSTTILFIPILLLGILKLFPVRSWQAFCTRQVDKIAQLWNGVNNVYLKRFKNVTWNITGLESITPQKWHLVIANHQSWLDIVVLQRLLNRKIPVLKFFIKDKLKWIPLLGFAWWAMGCPYMKRYSKQYLAKHPEKRGKDLEATVKALSLFKHTPASIMNFVEGTRFTVKKSLAQNTPFKHLLNPKAGGIGFVISSMGSQLKSLIDVTIVYDTPRNSLWDFLCQRIHRIQIHVREITIPVQFQSPLLVTSEQLQQQLREWLNEQWKTKDKLISTMIQGN